MGKKGLELGRAAWESFPPGPVFSPERPLLVFVGGNYESPRCFWNSFFFFGGGSFHENASPACLCVFYPSWYLSYGRKRSPTSLQASTCFGPPGHSSANGHALFQCFIPRWSGTGSVGRGKEGARGCLEKSHGCTCGNGQGKCAQRPTWSLWEAAQKRGGQGPLRPLAGWASTVVSVASVFTAWGTDEPPLLLWGLGVMPP